MIEDWSKYIRERICEPIRLALKGYNPGVGLKSSSLDIDGRIWYVKDQNGQKELLFKHLRCYVEEYLFSPRWRMIDKAIDDPQKKGYWCSKATSNLYSYTSGLSPVQPLFEGRDIIQVVENWIADYSYGFQRTKLHFRLLQKLAQEDSGIDWEEINSATRKEMESWNSETDKIRMQYYFYLNSLAQVAANAALTGEQRKKWLEKCDSNQGALSICYLIAKGLKVNPYIEDLASIVDKYLRNHVNYLSFLVVMFREYQQALDDIGGVKVLRDLEMKMRTNEQVKENYDLLAYMFPSSHWQDADMDLPPLTIADMWSRIADQESGKGREEEQQRMAELAARLKEELGRSISIEQLSEAILQCPPTAANLVFTQLDLHLEDVNEVWTSNRKELKQRVKALQDLNDKVLGKPLEAILLPPSLCKYIVTNGTCNPQEVEQELSKVCAGSAPDIVNYLRKGMKEGFIDLMGNDATTIYNTLNERYGLKFRLRNFYTYWK